MGSHNLGKVFDAGRNPDKVAIIDTANWQRRSEITYRAFDALCDAVARGLVRRGVKAGDRVGILALNRTEFLAAFFGTMRAGMITVPISIKLPRETIDYIIADAGLAAMFHDEARAGLCPAGTMRIGFDNGGFHPPPPPCAFRATTPARPR